MLTVNEPVRAPDGLIVQVVGGVAAKRFDPGVAVIEHGPASATLNEPETVTGPEPVKPEYVESVCVAGIPFTKFAVAKSARAPEPFTLTV